MIADQSGDDVAFIAFYPGYIKPAVEAESWYVKKPENKRVGCLLKKWKFEVAFTLRDFQHSARRAYVHIWNNFNGTC